jgi:hypothetical protein
MALSDACFEFLNNTQETISSRLNKLANDVEHYSHSSWGYDERVIEALRRAIKQAARKKKAPLNLRALCEAVRIMTFLRTSLRRLR